MRKFKNGKHSLRAAFAIVLSLVMILSMVLVSFGEGSIDDETGKPFTVIGDDKTDGGGTDGGGTTTGGGKTTGGNDGTGGGKTTGGNDGNNNGRTAPDVTGGSGTNTNIISTDVNPGTYSKPAVAEVVNNVNDGKNISVREIIEKTNQPEGKTDPAKFPTTAGYDVNLDMYDRITDFYELKLSDNSSDKEYKPGEVRIVVPMAKGMTGSDLMVMVINTETGEVFAVPPKKFNSETGELTVDLPCLGAYCVMHKVPIVVRNVDPDMYPDRDLAEIIKGLPSDGVLLCADLLKAMGVEASDKLEVAEGVTIDPAKYSSAMVSSDMAANLGAEGFSYDLSAKFNANMFVGNSMVDLERILDSIDADIDKSEAMADESVLTEIDPVKLEDSFVYHIDAATGEVSIIYEPEICWTTSGEISKLEEEQIEEEDVLYWNVEDVDSQNGEESQFNAEDDGNALEDIFVDEVYAAESSDLAAESGEEVCLVISGEEYLGMGPFFLFMPEKNNSFPWWILILIGAAAVIIFAAARKKKGDKAGQNEA